MSIKGKGNGNKGVSFQSKKVYNIRQLPEGEVKSGVYIYIYRDAKHRGIDLALFTDPEGDSCFGIYQISWIKMKKVTFCNLKASLSRNFVYNLQTFRRFCQVHFYDFVANFSA